MTKIEIVTNKIDIGRKRIDGSRTIIIEVDEYEQPKLAPILLLGDEYILKITIEDK